jgi:hypothetical protein
MMLSGPSMTSARRQPNIRSAPSSTPTMAPWSSAHHDRVGGRLDDTVPLRAHPLERPLRLLALEERTEVG